MTETVPIDRSPAARATVSRPRSRNAATVKAYTVKGFGGRMRDWCGEAKVPPMIDATGKSKNIASHGLRKLCLVRLAEAGCNVIEMQGISGHKDLRELQIYIDAANRKKAAAVAITKLIAAQSAAREAGTK